MSPESTTPRSAQTERTNPSDIALTLLEREPPFEGVDWRTPAAELSENARLVRLARVKAILPEDNAIEEKTTHDQTLENYKRLALVAAGDCETLNKFLSQLQATLAQSRDTHLAQQVFWIWAPVAEIIDAHEQKTELEQLAFEILMPEENDRINAIYRTANSREGHDYFNNLRQEIRLVLDMVTDDRAKCVIDARRKSNYSIWRKEQSTRRESVDLFDLVGFRVVVDCGEDEELAVQQCYAIKTNLEDVYDADPTRTKDYIAEPKATGYQSIHLTGYTTMGAPFEVQIRTKAMDEQTITDHKQDHQGYDATFKATPGKITKKFRRVPKLYQWRNAASRSIAINEGLTSEILGDEVLFFRADGNMYKMPSAGNVLDASFHVHNRRALRTLFAYRNGDLVGFDARVYIGDVLDFEYSAEYPSEAQRFDNLRQMVATKSAGKAIEQGKRRALSDHYYEEGINRICALVSDLGLEKPLKMLDEKDRQELVGSTGFRSFRSLIEAVGVEEPSAKTGRIVEMIRKRCGVGPVNEIKFKPEKPETFPDDEVTSRITIPSYSDQPECKIAGCCSSKIHFGDEIIARASRYDSALKIHRLDCNNVRTLEDALVCQWGLGD